jgi:hypothetical protein
MIHGLHLAGTMELNEESCENLTFGQAIFFQNGSGTVFSSTNSATATTTWTVPDGITSISAVCVGAGGGYGFCSGYYSGGWYQGGGGGGGGGLSYQTEIPVTPGEELTIIIGGTTYDGGTDYADASAGTWNHSSGSYIKRGEDILLWAEGGADGTHYEGYAYNYTGSWSSLVMKRAPGGRGGSSLGYDGGGDGGIGGRNYGMAVDAGELSYYPPHGGGGGGAGGYYGNGGNGGDGNGYNSYSPIYGGPPQYGSGGGAGGRSGSGSCYAGGAVGLYGAGSDGTGYTDVGWTGECGSRDVFTDLGTAPHNSYCRGGGSGSIDRTSDDYFDNTGYTITKLYYQTDRSLGGGVRIIYGKGRAYPSSYCGDM